MKYENLLIDAEKEGLIVKEFSLSNNDGLIKKNRIAIRKDIPTLKEKYCVLSEELGHYFTSSGDITNQSNYNNYKQELRARKWGYDKTIGISGFINSFEHGCRTLYEMAEFLEVTELYLRNAIDWYRSKYGLYTKYDCYIIYFEPSIAVIKLF